MIWKVRIVRDDWQDLRPWQVDGYLSIGRALESLITESDDPYDAYTERVENFGTFAEAADFAGLVAEALRAGGFSAEAQQHPLIWEAGQLYDEMEWRRES